MKAVIKVKIYAGAKKTRALRQALGNSRFIWNKLLEMNIEKYKKEGKFLFEFDMDREITRIKREYPFLMQSPAMTLQQIARKLDRSLKLFLKHKKEGVGFPKFKKKSKYDGILIFPQGFRFEGNKLRIPKIGWVRIKDKITRKPEWERIKENAKQVWVKEEVDGFFAYIVYERNKEEKAWNGRIVGIDVGIKSTITLSNGEVLSLDKNRIMRLVRKAEKLQSIIDKKRYINQKRGIKHSRRVVELEKKRDRILKKIRNIKRDFYYKAVNHILKRYEYVVIEDLDLGELKEHKLENKVASRKVHKYLQYISLGEFFRILEWKAELYGRKIVKVEANHTSKTCSRCGYVNHDLKLSERVFKCPKCGLKIDRDLNASINILKKGIEKLISSGHGEYRREMAGQMPCLYAEPTMEGCNWTVVVCQGDVAPALGGEWVCQGKRLTYALQPNYSGYVSLDALSLWIP